MRLLRKHGSWVIILLFFWWSVFQNRLWILQPNTWTSNPNFLPFSGFAFVKELTLDVQNVIAPPKEKSLAPKKEVEVVSSSDADSKTDKKQSSGEEASEKETTSEQSEGKTSDVNARDKNGSLDDSNVRKGIEADGSPRTKDDTRRYAFVLYLMCFGSMSFHKKYCKKRKIGYVIVLQRRMHLGWFMLSNFLVKMAMMMVDLLLLLAKLQIMTLTMRQTER